MIAKRVPRTKGTSRAARLVRYMVAAQGGIEPESWAREDKRESARRMRDQGMTQREIAAALGVSQPTVSLWLRDIK